MDYRPTIEYPPKWNLLRLMGKRFELDTLVETGGYHGATMEYLQGDFRRLVTIELGPDLFDDIYARGIPNVLCLKGDSGRVLGQFLLFFDDPALFWLDAHPSGGDTAGGPDSGVFGTVAAVELQAVLERNNPLDVILVDDIGHVGLEKEFIGKIVSGYPDWELRFSGEFPECIALITKRGRIAEDA